MDTLDIAEKVVTQDIVGQVLVDTQDILVVVLVDTQGFLEVVFPVIVDILVLVDIPVIQEILDIPDTQDFLESLATVDIVVQVFLAIVDIVVVE